MILHCNNLNFKLYFLFLFLFTLFSLFILAVKQYREQKSCRIEKISKDRKFVERNCLNPEDIIGQGLEEECHIRKHRMHEDPELYAFYDVLESLNICTTEGCKVGITAKPIIFLYLIIINNLYLIY